MQIPKEGQSTSSNGRENDSVAAGGLADLREGRIAAPRGEGVLLRVVVQRVVPLDERHLPPAVGFGRIVAPETEAPNMSVNLI